MISDPLLVHIQTHLRLGPLYNSQVSVGEWDGIYKFKESFRPDLRLQDGYPVVHLRECSGCITSQHEDFSHQFLCRVIPAFVHLQVQVVSCLHVVSYRDTLLQVLASPLGNGSQYCGYMGLLHIICKFTSNFLNLCNHSFVLLLTIHVDKLPEDLGLPFVLSCTLVLRHAAGVWYSQPTLLNFKENSALDACENCTLLPLLDWHPILL